MMYAMLAYLMLFAALSNAVCLYNALLLFFLLIFENAFCFMLCLGLLTHSLFISSMIFHHALCFRKFTMPAIRALKPLYNAALS